MQRLITLSLSILIFIHALAQNETYSICEHRINSENVSYTEAKRAWLAVDNARERFDPVCTLDLLSQSLEQGDTIFFKEELSFLIEARGFELNQRYVFEDYYDDLTIGNLKQWYDSTFFENNSIWKLNNPVGAEVQARILQLFDVDQILLRAAHAVANLELTASELSYIRGYFQTEYEQQVYREFMALCKSIDQVPNNFNHGMMSSEISRLIIEHSLENDANDFKQKWSQIFPIWERQFMEGYFDTSLLKTFDLTSEIFTGKQYFGTLLNVPCEDEQGLEARKVKFGLLN